MKILFIVPHGNRPSTRYRVMKLLPALRGRGLECDVVPLPDSLFARLRLFRRCRGYDIVFLQRKLLPTPLFRYLRANARRLAYDFDDAVAYREESVSSGHGERHDLSRTRTRRFSQTVRAVDMVIAGNRYLAGLALEHGAPQGKVEVLPTSIDIERWGPKSRQGKEEDTAVLGWMGTKGNLRYVVEIAPALAKLGQRYPQVSLKLVCDAFVDIPGIKTEKKIWRESEESDDVRSFDMGIAPLPDNPWTRGKCAFKILTYSASGIPVVCSPVGANREAVIDGETGFLAANEKEWLDRLSLLVEDRELRERMGGKGRSYIASKYSSELTGNELAGLLNELGEGVR